MSNILDYIEYYGLYGKSMIIWKIKDYISLYTHISLPIYQHTSFTPWRCLSAQPCCRPRPGSSLVAGPGRALLQALAKPLLLKGPIGK